MLYIIPSHFADTEIGSVIEKVAAQIEKAGGKLSRHENVGKLKLAYPIENTRHGTYVLAHFEAKTEAMKNLDRQLQLSTEILRHQIMHLPADAVNKPCLLTSYVPPLSEEGRREGTPTGTSFGNSLPRPLGENSTAVPAIDAPSLSIAELDKKLDAILTEDVVKEA